MDRDAVEGFALGFRNLSVNPNNVGKPVIRTIKEGQWYSENPTYRLDELMRGLMNAAFVAAHSGAAGRFFQPCEDTKPVLRQPAQLPCLAKALAEYRVGR